MRILLVLTLFSVNSFCQNVPECETDECYKKYIEQIKDYKDLVSNLPNRFDELIHGLKVLNKSLTNLNEDLKFFPNNSWSDAINAAKETAEISADSEFATENDIEKIRKQLSEWINFLENFKKIKNDILNIPYSVTAEIDFIDSLLKNGKDENCLQKFHDELKKLFATIATLFKFEDFISKLKKVVADADNNRKRAENILEETYEILDKEEQLKKVVVLAKKTLEEAEKLEQLKKEISKLLRGYDSTISKVDEALKKFDTDFKILLKKYKRSRYEVLLDQLKATTEELEALTGGEPVDIMKIEENINMYSECLNCYHEFLTKCGKKINISEYCKNKIKEC